MKNNRTLTVYLLFIYSGFMVSCSKGPSSPEKVTLKFFDLLYNEHDLEKAEELVTMDSREKLRNDFKFIEGALQIVEEKEPVHYAYKTINEKTELRDDSAFVYITSSLDTSSMKILLKQIDKEWKIDFNYNENAVNPTTKDLVDEVLELMEGFADSVTIDTDTLTLSK